MKVMDSRQEICDILDGKSKRLMMIVGPCSIHNPDSAIEYAERLRALSEEVKERILIVMRVYFEKPRTTLGWKGLIYDPDLNASYNIEKGIFIARRLMLKIVDLGLPVATEMLDPIIAQYIADAVSWAAIGARTTEAQTHRQLGSGLSMPVGFKNATDGSFQIAIDAISTARSEHSFIGVLEDGHVGVFRTRGNPYAHIVLRGGGGPNYGAEHIAFLKVAMKKAKIPPAIIVDCSHANSGKDYRKQGIVLRDVLSQIADGETALAGRCPRRGQRARYPIFASLKCGPALAPRPCLHSGGARTGADELLLLRPRQGQGASLLQDLRRARELRQLQPVRRITKTDAAAWRKPCCRFERGTV